MNHLLLSAALFWIIIAASAALFGPPVCLAWEPPTPEPLTSTLAPAEIGWIVGDSVSDGYGVILKTTDGGATWQRQGNATQIPDVELYGVHGLDRNTLWVVGDEGTILHTTNGGQTWTQQTGGTIPVGHYEGIWAIDSRHVWAGGVDADTGNGVILWADDGGATWQRKGVRADVSRTLRDQGLRR